MDTYEKKYKAVLEQARDYYNRVQTDYARKELENIFPELRESEDERIRQQLLWLCDEWEHNPEGRTIPADIDNIKQIRGYLEKQKEQNNEFHLPPDFGIAYYNPKPIKQKEQKPAEWSEEDEKFFALLHSALYQIKVRIGKDEYDRAVAWLESLRPSWKPSEEQMNYLCAAVDAAIRKHNESVSGYELARVLKSLYEDLKKL